MSNVQNGCCDENETVLPSPKEEMRKRKSARMPVLYELENPIPEEIRDTEELKSVIDKFKLVPYAGNDKHTGHNTLNWYLMLAKLSPTHGGAIEKLTKYAVGGRAMFARSENPDYDIGEETQPLTRAEKERYEAAITQFIEFKGGVRDYHRLLTASLKATGNAWVEMSVADRAGQRRVSLRFVKQQNVMYRKSASDEMRFGVISPIWTDEYLKKNEPSVIPLYPNFVKVDGVQKTLFHLKNGDFNWYGRPDSQSADLYKYREVQDAMYIVKQAANNFTGQLIIELEDDGQDPAIDETGAWQAGFNSFADRMIENYTQRGKDPMSVFVTSRAFGAKPMFVFQVAPNTNEKWYVETGKMSENYILGSHGCTLRFMGKEAANGFSTDAFVADYVMNMEPVINDLRTTVMVFSNSILTTAWEALGMQEMNDISLTFQSPIQSRIDEYKNATAQGMAPQSPQIQTV
jgi:hypothetical protein